MMDLLYLLTLLLMASSFMTGYAFGFRQGVREAAQAAQEERHNGMT
jgi:hypothetical protein